MTFLSADLHNICTQIQNSKLKTQNSKLSKYYSGYTMKFEYPPSGPVYAYLGTACCTIVYGCALVGFLPSPSCGFGSLGSSGGVPGRCRSRSRAAGSPTILCEFMRRVSPTSIRRPRLGCCDSKYKRRSARSASFPIACFRKYRYAAMS